jgi:hypothetical protein
VDQPVNRNSVIEGLRAQAPAATHYVVFDACRNELKLTRKGKKALSDKGFVPIADTPGAMVAGMGTSSASARGRSEKNPCRDKPLSDISAVANDSSGGVRRGRRGAQRRPPRLGAASQYGGVAWRRASVRAAHGGGRSTGVAVGCHARRPCRRRGQRLRLGA